MKKRGKGEHKPNPKTPNPNFKYKQHPSNNTKTFPNLILATFKRFKIKNGNHIPLKSFQGEISVFLKVKNYKLR
jgi:hypothetical protein